MCSNIFSHFKRLFVFIMFCCRSCILWIFWFTDDLFLVKSNISFFPYVIICPVSYPPVRNLCLALCQIDILLYFILKIFCISFYVSVNNSFWIFFKIYCELWMEIHFFHINIVISVSFIKNMFYLWVETPHGHFQPWRFSRLRKSYYLHV